MLFLKESKSLHICFWFSLVNSFLYMDIIEDTLKTIIYDGKGMFFIDSEISEGVYLTEMFSLEGTGAKRFFISDFMEKEEDESESENEGVVKVAKVNTIRMQGKTKRMGMRPAGRRANWKKAMVTLTADSKTIELFEGMV